MFAAVDGAALAGRGHVDAASAGERAGEQLRLPRQQARDEPPVLAPAAPAARDELGEDRPEPRGRRLVRRGVLRGAYGVAVPWAPDASASTRARGAVVHPSSATRHTPTVMRITLGRIDAATL